MLKSLIRKLKKKYNPAQDDPGNTTITIGMFFVERINNARIWCANPVEGGEIKWDEGKSLILPPNKFPVGTQIIVRVPRSSV